MASEMSFNPENLAHLRHMISYSETILDPDTTREDMMTALENLIAREIGVNTKDAYMLLSHDSSFYGCEYALYMDKAGIDEKGRMQKEIYALAPLMILWRHIKELRDLATAKLWLESAIDMALGESELHDEYDCYCYELAPGDGSCDVSPLCPIKVTTKELIYEATTEPEQDAVVFEDPRHLLAMVRMQLDLAWSVGLITKIQRNELLDGYQEKRAGLSEPDSSDE